jgi:glycosyltransferase involved in cell wall biosynthesis
LEEKKKILVIADHPLSPSGVGTQTKYFIDGLLKTGRYKFICFGGAVSHENYNPAKVEGHGDDFIIYPVDGYGTPEMLRSCLRKERPDVLWIMTDPRFWGWLWEMEDEIRPLVPLVYYHVWDNYPYPMYNKRHYMSNDKVVTISRLTDDIVRTVAPEVETQYLPHAVNTDIFRPLEGDGIKAFKKEHNFPENKVMFFWNNRNARRKQSGSLIFWFKKFLDKVGHDKAFLLMHTDVGDPHGQDLSAIIKELGLINGQVQFSQQKVPAEVLAIFYNAADCTINISDAEGFGLATLESLSCGTPIIVTKTGGLQDQVTDGKDYFGIEIEPASKAIIGSQGIPYIREDRLNEDDVVDALVEMYEMSKEDREELGRKGFEYARKNFNFSEFQNRWIKVIDDIVERHGSWDTRKSHKSWKIKEVV